MPEDDDQMNSENKSRQQREQHAELENETMEVEWAPSTPARENIQPSVRTRMQEKNKPREHLRFTPSGSNKRHVNTKKKSMNYENMNKKFQWVTATLSQENLDYISNQPIYILTGNKERKQKKDTGSDDSSSEEGGETPSQGNLGHAPWEQISKEQRNRYTQEMKQITLARRGSPTLPKQGTSYDPWATRKAAMKTRENAKQAHEPSSRWKAAYSNERARIDTMNREQKISLPPPKRDEQMSQADREDMEIFDSEDEEIKIEREEQERKYDEPRLL